MYTYISIFFTDFGVSTTTGVHMRSRGRNCLYSDRSPDNHKRKEASHFVSDEK